MGTELAKVETKSFLAMQKGNAVGEAMAANLGEGATMQESDLTRVPIPTGGGTNWTIPSITGDESCKAIEGILVYQQARGLLWGGEEPQEGELPVLATNDLVTAHLVNENPDPKLLEEMEPARDEDGTYRWKDLPQNQWGSGRKGRGKRCREQRVLFVLRENDPLPLVINISPGSLKEWGKFIVGLTKHAIPYYRAVISLTLTKEKTDDGTAYSRVVPTLVGVLSESEGKKVQETFSVPMNQIAQQTFIG